MVCVHSLSHSSHPLETVHHIIRTSARLLASVGENTVDGKDASFVAASAVQQRALDVLLSISGCLSIPGLTKPVEIQHFIYNHVS